MTWQTADAAQPACYGILGEVPRPAVYSATGRTVTLQDLVQQAGGLTAHSSPTVRIVRYARTAQAIFFSPSGRDVLQPHDIVVVDSQPAHRSRFDSTAAAESLGGVWVCFLGVLNRPAIVWFPDPQQARLPAVVQALGQSKELAQRVLPVLPPRSAWMSSADAPLPSGAVLVFDPTLLVTQNLPALPDTVPMNASASATPQFAEGETPVPEPNSAPISGDPPWSTQLASQPRSPVEAIPVPYSAPSAEPTEAESTSLPVPGSRIHEQWEAIAKPAEAPTAKRRTIDPQLAADQDVEIFPAVEEDEPVAAEPVANRGIISLWQMLGIGGTVALLIGIAVATRGYFDRAKTPAYQSFERPAADSLPDPVTEKTASRKQQSAEMAAPARQATSSATEPDDLDDILRGSLPIISEIAQFPRRFPLQMPHDPTGALYRVDAKQRTPVPMPHNRSRETIAAAAARDAGPIPRPHLLGRPDAPRHPKSSETSDVSRAAVLAHGTPLERALSQLQGGRRP